MVQYYTINSASVKVNFDELIANLCSKDDKNYSFYMELIKREYKTLIENIDLKSGYALFDCELIDKYELKVKDVVFDLGKIIASQLKNIEKVVLLALTLGERIDELIKNSFAEDVLRGYILNELASEFTDRAADILEEEILLRMTNEGYKITNRYSPGYCEWNVSEQNKFFSLLPENFCGIKLTNSGLMYPIKSISAIIGVGKKVKRTSYICSICDLKDCYKRKN